MGESDTVRPTFSIPTRKAKLPAALAAITASTSPNKDRKAAGLGGLSNAVEGKAPAGSSLRVILEGRRREIVFPLFSGTHGGASTFPLKAASCGIGEKPPER